MDHSQLIKVLAAKYKIDIRTPQGTMALFNKLCLSLNNDQIIKQNQEGHNNNIDQYNKTISKLNQKLGLLRAFATVSLTNSFDKKSLVEMASGLGIEIKTRDGKPYLDIKVSR